MQYKTKSIRAFIGCKDYSESREFYRLMGFKETELGDKMCYITIDDQSGFYLQDAYVKDWVDNSMLFLELTNLDQIHAELAALRLQDRYELVRLSEIRQLDWGREFFLHDPSGILWHIGEFN
ncbi:MAG: glyoxalase [Cyclobacteriaceae bacterium]